MLSLSGWSHELRFGFAHSHSGLKQAHSVSYFTANSVNRIFSVAQPASLISSECHWGLHPFSHTISLRQEPNDCSDFSLGFCTFSSSCWLKKNQPKIWLVQNIYYPETSFMYFCFSATRMSAKSSSTFSFTAFSRRFCPKQLTVIHTFTHWWRWLPCKVLTSTIRSSFGVQYLAQGHFNTQTRGIEPAALWETRRLLYPRWSHPTF